MTTAPSGKRSLQGLAVLSVALLVPAAALAKTAPTEKQTAAELAAAARMLDRPSVATPSTGVIASRSARLRVSVVRAQRNARRFAHDVYLQDDPAFDYGTGVNSNCTRHSPYRVTCMGWIDTYADEDINQEEPLTCWFGVRTTGMRYRYLVSYVSGSAYCEPQV